MTNGLSCPHIPLPTACYHGDISQLKSRHQEISIKDSLVDTGVWGNQYKPTRSFNLSRVGGGKVGRWGSRTQ